ncbi:palmitoyltransferase ZDHHC21-like isoform X1 [Biomphalaria glabrata]|uniref:Palmitoyltransferase n=1 Tax=Biomphalaria glabrata TaxID=6526 RepID=A0A2C9KPB9_BIOGL|nr:palmitoyltransferase ZDHHC21-like isoform X1 [Biomphalaria glabrata]
MINMNNIMNLIPSHKEESTLHLPCLGRVHVVSDREGRCYASIVLAYWLYGTFAPLFIIVKPAYEDGVISWFVVYGYYLVSALCLLSFLSASLKNPGNIPSYTGTENEADTKWNKCKVCNQMRPPRAHHCRRCGHCVMKMDHHCPWINNCVGENNHFAFILLLLYAFLLSLYAFVLVMLHFWVFPKCVSCDKEVFYIKHSIWFMYLEFILSLQMMSLMGIQLFQQHLNVLRNKTTLETMMDPRSTLYIQGQCSQSYREICGQGHPLFWLIPIGKRKALPSDTQYYV